MDPIERTFLADIFAAPDDDGPRLIYADWLEDNGRPERAEFIRVQCEVARLPSRDRRRRGTARLLAREAELWGMRRDGRCPARAVEGHDPIPDLADVLSWKDPLPKKDSAALLWARGFGHAVRCKLDPWLAWGVELCRHHPVASVRITDCRPMGSGWYATDILTLRSTANVPVRVWEHLEGVRELRHGWKYYVDAKQALAALNAAALAWARR